MTKPSVATLPPLTDDFVEYFGGSQFLYDSAFSWTDNCLLPDLDILFIRDSVPTTTSTTAKRIIYLAGETGWTYDDLAQDFFLSFFAQFDHIYSPLPIYLHNVTSAMPFLPSMLGGSHANYMADSTCSLDLLLDLPRPTKYHEPYISVFDSTQRWKQGHRQRSKLISILSDRFGHHLHVYGAGSGRTLSTKLEALSKYKYHLAIENQILPYVVTEKLTDPLLAYTVPIYAGGHLPEAIDHCTLKIDISSIDSVSRCIENLIQDDPYINIQGQLQQARNYILTGHNFLKRMESIATHHIQATPASEDSCIRTLYPLDSFHQSYLSANSILNRLRNKFF